MLTFFPKSTWFRFPERAALVRVPLSSLQLLLLVLLSFTLHISPFQPPFLKLLVTVPFPWLRRLDTYILLCFCYYNYFCHKRRAFPKPPSCSHLDNITDTEKYIVIPLPGDSLMKTKLALLLQGVSASDWGLINILKGIYASQVTFKNSLDGAVKGKPATSHQTGSSKFMLINFCTSLKKLGFPI